MMRDVILLEKLLDDILNVMPIFFLKNLKFIIKYFFN